MNLGVDPRHADQMVRGAVAMPNGTGKDVRVAVFARDDKATRQKQLVLNLLGLKNWLSLFKMVKMDLTG